MCNIIITFNHKGFWKLECNMLVRTIIRVYFRSNYVCQNKLRLCLTASVTILNVMYKKFCGLQCS